mmetsp:Transcript_11501/g.23400  ORF Transcript_11501/g.23400 Transcript_11501/m.23400 type:complete len:219 (-) Transcript_11501:147-803(-)
MQAAPAHAAGWTAERVSQRAGAQLALHAGRRVARFAAAAVLVLRRARLPRRRAAPPRPRPAALPRLPVHGHAAPAARVGPAVRSRVDAARSAAAAAPLAALGRRPRYQQRQRWRRRRRRAAQRVDQVAALGSSSRNRAQTSLTASAQLELQEKFLYGQLFRHISWRGNSKPPSVGQHRRTVLRAQPGMQPRCSSPAPDDWRSRSCPVASQLGFDAQPA